MNKFLLSTLLISALPLFGLSQNINLSKEDSRIEEQVLYGQITLDAFDLEVCKNWYAPEYNAYQTNKKIIKQLSDQNLKKISINLVFGSWCHDSHREVPRFIKILEEIKFPFSQLQMHALDSYKKSPSYNAEANKVEFVPTMIIYKGENEIGRIIESPKLTLEEDLFIIISKN